MITRKNQLPIQLLEDSIYTDRVNSQSEKNVKLTQANPKKREKYPTRIINHPLLDKFSLEGNICC